VPAALRFPGKSYSTHFSYLRRSRVVSGLLSSCKRPQGAVLQVLRSAQNMKTLLRILVVALCGLAVFLSQLQSVSWHWRFSREFNLLNYGSSLLFAMLVETFWGLVGGTVVGLLISTKQLDRPDRGRILLYAVVLSLLPAVVLIARMVTATEGRLLLSLPYNPFLDWATNSPVPALWLGISLSWAARQLLPNWAL